jgi:hypothetical protein
MHMVPTAILTLIFFVLSGAGGLALGIYLFSKSMTLLMTG